jgi:hypothetical protein
MSTPFPITFDAGVNLSKSLTTSMASDPISIGDTRTTEVAIQLIWTTGAVGSINISGTVDGTVYTTLSTGMAITVSGTGSDQLIILNNLPLVALRIDYTRSSGSGGTLSGTYQVKRNFDR